MIARALGWSLLASLSGMAIQLVAMVVLSRLLDATEFGLMAAAALAMRFVTYFSRAGLGPALIQRPSLEPGHHAAAMVASGLIGLLIWVAFLVLAGPFAHYFRARELAAVLAVTPAALLLASLVSVPQALLRRELRFKALAVCDLAGLSIGYVAVSVLLATLGFGVWSLVFGSIAQQAITLVASIWRARPHLRALPQRRHYSDLLGYGGRYTVVSFLDFLSSNVETLFIGRYLGTSSLGIYNRVSSVTSLPIEQVMSSVQRVAFPALARMGDRDPKLPAALRLSIQLSALITFPMAIAMSVAAEGLVLTILGPRWHEAVDIARVSVWAIPAVYLSAFMGNALDAMAAFRGKAFAILSVTALKLGLMVALGFQGLIWVMGAMVVAEWLRALWLVRLICMRTGLGMHEVPGALKFGLGVGLAIGALLALGTMLAGALLPPAASVIWPFALEVLVAVVAFIVLARRCIRHIVRDEAASGLDLSALRRIAFI